MRRVERLLDPNLVLAASAVALVAVEAAYRTWVSTAWLFAECAIFSRREPQHFTTQARRQTHRVTLASGFCLLLANLFLTLYLFRVVHGVVEFGNSLEEILDG